MALLWKLITLSGGQFRKRAQGLRCRDNCSKQVCGVLIDPTLCSYWFTPVIGAISHNDPASNCTMSLCSCTIRDQCPYCCTIRYQCLYCCTMRYQCLFCCTLRYQCPYSCSIRYQYPCIGIISCIYGCINVHTAIHYGVSMSIQLYTTAYQCPYKDVQYGV